MSVTRKVMWSSMGWLLCGVDVRESHHITVNAYSIFLQAACDFWPVGLLSGRAGLVAPLRLGLVERLVGAGQHGGPRGARGLPGGRGGGGPGGPGGGPG